MAGELTIRDLRGVVDLVMDGEPFATIHATGKRDPLAIAEEIKRRWDAHDGLLDSLTEAHGFVSEIHKWLPDTTYIKDEVKAVLTKIERALAKARGQS